MEWMEGLGPVIAVGFFIVAALMLMFLARLLFQQEPWSKTGGGNGAGSSK